MNRAKKMSRMYDDNRTAIDEVRYRHKVAQRLARSIRPDSTMAELRKMATLLAIPGRASANRETLIQKIRGRV